MPTAFNIQLRRLATDTPELLPHLVNLRLLSRWMRCTWGSATPFYKLYSNIFGHRYSHEVFASDFNNLVTSSKLEDYTLTIDDDEAILAMTELILATTAPMYYASDMAMAMLTTSPVLTVPTHTGFRSLDSTTLSHVLLDSSIHRHVLQEFELLLNSAAASELQRSAASQGASTDVDMNDNPTHDTLTSWLRDVTTLCRIHASSTSRDIVSTHITLSLERLELTQADPTAIPSAQTQSQG
ncbi:hypothetical protein AC1031_011058 [Aphanomyces cochlioides]|nr:hypothetical protein AC1031_011058 [Aphanomyces cochlioides]